ncbi:hypothetical protein AB1N83_010852 [Pleurotus pulmonarius]
MPKNDVVFAVMGPSGAGKSEFVNYASRQFKNGSIGDNWLIKRNKDEEKRLLKELHEAERQESSALAEVRKQLSETITQIQSLKDPLGKTIARFFG